MQAKREWQLYGLGHAAILLGSTLMAVSGSLVPMALGASAGLMLSLPLARHYRTRWRPKPR